MSRMRHLWTRALVWLYGRLAGPNAPPVLPPVRLAYGRHWQLHVTDADALGNFRYLLNQDMVRWLGGERTYLPPRLLTVVERLVPEQPAIVLITHEAWVLIAQALVTYQIVQEHLAPVPLLDDVDPDLLHLQLLALRHLERIELTDS